MEVTDAENPPQLTIRRWSPTRVKRESGLSAFLCTYDEQVFGGHQRIAVARCVRRGANGYDGPVGHHRTGERPVEEGGQVFASANRWVTEDDAEEK